MSAFRIFFDISIRLVPVLGVILLSASFTSADLNDEVAIKTNKLKATTLSLSIQDTVDNSAKFYLFNSNRFQKDSLDVTSLRIRNTGQEKSKYFLIIRNDDANQESCTKPDLKILKDDVLIYKGKINNLKQNMDELASGEKNDLVFILTLNEQIKTTVPCRYQLEISTNIEKTPNKGLYDQKNIDSEVQILSQ